MMTNGVVAGRWFELTEGRLTIFDLKGASRDSLWRVDIERGGREGDMVDVVDLYARDVRYEGKLIPPSRDSEELVFHEIERCAHGSKAHLITAIAVSNRTAVGLWFEGLLSFQNFLYAKETSYGMRVPLLVSRFDAAHSPFIRFSYTEQFVVASPFMEEDEDIELDAFPVRPAYNGSFGVEPPVSGLKGRVDARNFACIVVPGARFDTKRGLIQVPLFVYPERVVGKQFIAIIDRNGIAI